MFNIIIKECKVTITNRIERDEIEDEISWNEIFRKQDHQFGGDWSGKDQHQGTNWWSEKISEANETGKNAEGGLEVDDRFTGETADKPK
jgi:hypothetical protein